ncbi:MAG: phosphoenolpyruvate--protein phosphotransferase [Candidatus Sumerlaeaceae bacterium]|nr:phosphoenolpyruvate--protein phosphotransferase [Candidatus Sumerlaeaceae bacterium]
MTGQRNTEERIFEGIAASPGIASGRARVIRHSIPLVLDAYPLADDEVEPEVQRFLGAVEAARRQLQSLREDLKAEIDERHASILGAQAMFLEDEELIDKTVEAIRRDKKNAEYLFQRRSNELIEVLGSVKDEVFRGRIADVMDVVSRVLRILMPTAHEPSDLVVPDTIIVAHDLAPSETTTLIRRHVRALVLEKGGPTSHTVIIAKALEIPAVVGLANITSFVEDGDPLIVDGLTGQVVVRPTPDTILHYDKERGAFTAREQELATLRDLEAETLDGYSVHLRANIEFPVELDHVIQHGARGIGLFRTEFLYMNRSGLPSEEEQFQIYKQALEAVRPHSVVFRTLDIGGDKFFSHVEVSRELNSFMGQRAIRLCLQHPEMFREQLRAMLRASVYGRTRILIPMISGLEEFLEVKKQFRQAKEELKHARVLFDPNVELGAMIEVPSAAVVAETLAQECDFFSIGTNDLIQYTLAVDRGNESVAYLYEPLHPAILRLIRQITNAARDNGIPVSVCGEVAADPLIAVILIGMGADELSMSAVSLPAVKRIIRSIRIGEARALAEECLFQTTIEGVRQVVRRRLKNYISQNRSTAWLQAARTLSGL